MATIIQKPNKSIEIRYVDAKGIRRSLYPGKIAKRTAESIGSRIDHIVSRQVIGGDPDRDVAEWIAKIAESSTKLHDKLVKAGLAVPRTKTESEPVCELAPTIRQWTDDYIASHPGAPRTIVLLNQTARSLCYKFGDDKRIDTFTAGDAETYRKFLQSQGNERKNYKTGLAKNTVRRMIGRSKQFFKAAMKHEIIHRNPFENEASAVSGNEDRLFLVPAEWIEACIRQAPCEDWRIILVLCQTLDLGLSGKGVRHQKPERPFGCFALLVPDPFSRDALNPCF